MDTVIRLRPDAALSENGDGRTLTFPDGSAELRDLSPGVRAALDALTGGDLDDTGLGAKVLGLDGPVGLARWQHLRTRLDAGGLLERTVRDCRATPSPGSTTACWWSRRRPAIAQSSCTTRHCWRA
jgi:hypothetical protein